jgi:hypothetical protein
MTITLNQIRDQLAAEMRKNAWDHAIKVVDIIEADAEADLHYRGVVQYWLDGHGSTIWLRDEVMEPLRHRSAIIEIGQHFNPTTEWDNTWMPLDTAAHRARYKLDPEER